MRLLLTAAAAYACAGNAASASDLLVQLPDVPKVATQVVRYQCSSDTAAIGLPKPPFEVTYLTAGDNRLAVIELHGKRLIFVAVGSGASARYVSGVYSWWDEPGRGTFLAADLPRDIGGMQSALCQRAASP
jgi:membrane-bound inhibitor of C-type lysozyme